MGFPASAKSGVHGQLLSNMFEYGRKGDDFHVVVALSPQVALGVTAS